MASNPMQQFTVHRIGPEIKIAGIDLSFTNASLFMVISAISICLLLFLGTKKRKIVPRTNNQNTYFKLLKSKNIIFAIGPAGTCLLYTSDAADE